MNKDQQTAPAARHDAVGPLLCFGLQILLSYMAWRVLPSPAGPNEISQFLHIVGFVLTLPAGFMMMCIALSARRGSLLRAFGLGALLLLAMVDFVIAIG